MHPYPVFQEHLYENTSLKKSKKNNFIRLETISNYINKINISISSFRRTNVVNRVFMLAISYSSRVLLEYASFPYVPTIIIKSPNRATHIIITCIAYTTLLRVVVKSFRFLEIRNTSSFKLSKIQNHKNFLSLISPKFKKN